MAWPVNARFLTAIASNPITAALGNAIQDAIKAIYGGTNSLVSLWVDGTGNTASAVAAGQARFSGGAASSGTTAITLDGGDFSCTGLYKTTWNVGSSSASILAPTASNSAPLGSHVRESVACGCALVDFSGGGIALHRGFNVRTATKNVGSGSWTIIFNVSPSFPSAAWAVASVPLSVSGGVICTVGCLVSDDGSGRIRCDVTTYAGTTLTDLSFTIIAHAQ